MLLLRGLWSLFAAAMTLVGVILANYGADVLLTRISTLETAARESLLFRIGFNVVGGLLGFLLGLKSFRRLIAWANYMETVSLLDKITTVVGILIGLVVAILASTPFANVAGVGLPIRIFACIVGIVLGIGFATSAKEQLVYVFPGLAPERTGGILLTAASLAKMLDTNIIIDGRIADIAATGFLEGPIVVPGFVLQELRHIAGSSDGLKRARGRRGLDMLNRLNQLDSVRVEVVEDYPKGLDQTEEVDQRLVSFAELVGACVVTNDYGVNEIAKLKSVPVLNVNELANAMKPVYLPGEDMSVALVKEGKEPGQGVAYLDDGTMVVVEGGASALGQTVAVVVTSVLQTTAGKMIFSELLDEDGHSPTINGNRRKRERK